MLDFGMTDLFLSVLQSETSQLTASFKYTDKESGVDHIKLKIFEVYHGSRTQKYPGNIISLLIVWLKLNESIIILPYFKKICLNRHQLVHFEFEKYRRVDIFQIHVMVYTCFLSILFEVVRNEWKDLPSGDMTSYTWTGLSLRNGARYTMRVGAINHAGFLASFETNGVVIDITLPMVIA